MQLVNIGTCNAVSEEEGSFAPRFYHWFWDSFKELSFTSAGFARFNWHTLAQLLAWSSLLWLSMTWLQRYLTQKNFLSITSLTWTLVLYLLLYSGRRSLYGERKKNKRTHTHTHPVKYYSVNCKLIKKVSWISLTKWNETCNESLCRIAVQILISKITGSYLVKKGGILKFLDVVHYTLLFFGIIVSCKL